MKLKQLSEEQEKLMVEVRDEWINRFNSLSFDEEKAKELMLFYYELANFDKPLVFVFDSPLALQYACSIIPKYINYINVFLKKKKSSQVLSQVDSQVDSQVWSQVDSQVWSQVLSQVRSQVLSQVLSQVRSQVDSQVRSQVLSQVDSQVDSQVWSQVDSQVLSQVDSQVDSQVWSQDDTHKFVSLPLSCLTISYSTSSV